MKKIAFILLAISLIFILSACGSGEKAASLDNTKKAPVQVKITTAISSTSEGVQSTASQSINDLSNTVKGLDNTLKSMDGFSDINQIDLNGL